jgi:hypothetical protein
MFKYQYGRRNGGVLKYMDKSKGGWAKEQVNESWIKTYAYHLRTMKCGRVENNNIEKMVMKWRKELELTQWDSHSVPLNLKRINMEQYIIVDFKLISTF